MQRTLNEALAYCKANQLTPPQRKDADAWEEYIEELLDSESPHGAAVQMTYDHIDLDEMVDSHDSDADSDWELEDEEMTADGGYKADKPAKQLPSRISTDETFKGNGDSQLRKRRKASGPVTAELETIQHVTRGPVQRPVRVSGFVEPTVTKGRPSAPEPSSGLQLAVRSNEEKTGRNRGVVDAEKGHIMALELGGPDKPWNIVPQWAKWQGCGEWRKAEKNILALAKQIQAKKDGSKLLFDARAVYKQYLHPAQGAFKTLTVPSAFKVYVTECDAKGKPKQRPQIAFDGEQKQDATDFKISARVFDLADADLVSDSDSDSESDSGSPAAAAAAAPSGGSRKRPRG